MTVGKSYLVKFNMDDMADVNEYPIVIISDLGYCYEATMIDLGYTFNFYPEDWLTVRELSSLEIELL